MSENEENRDAKAPAEGGSPTEDASAESPEIEAAPELEKAESDDAGSVAPAPRAGIPVEPSRLAPEAERMAAPSFAAKTIADPVASGPSTLFLAVVSVVSLASDVLSKLWAEKRLEAYPGYIDVIEGHLAFTLAKNKGGAWGLLQGTSEALRRPFFLLVSIAAISFIVTLYRRLGPRQQALKWGLPLVLGGALGNVFDRLRYGHVIDFIDYRSDWVRSMNEWIAKKSAGHVVTDHWPTFNVADVAICIGVALMAIDMFTSKRGKKPADPDVPVTAPANASPSPAEVLTDPAKPDEAASTPEA